MIGPLWAAAWRWRRRTLAALLLLVLAKVAGVLVPMLLKAVVDRFGQEVGGVKGQPPGIAVLPVFLLLGYAALRFAGTLFTELRDLVFARVSLGTVKDFADRAFRHLLRLGARFHTQRNTGSLLRDVERGTAGIGFLLGAGVFTIVPTLVEFSAILLILSFGYGLWFTLVVGLTFIAYAGFTMSLTQQRMLRQRRVNELDSRAAGHMVDTLLNHEAVSTHAREAAEGRRYAAVLAQWVDGSVSNQRALFRLHIGQSAIIAGGVAVVMLLAGQETLQGRMTVGDLILVNAYVIQICLPLNTLGFVFREARDALVNTEKLLSLFAQAPEVQERPDARTLQSPAGTVAFEQVDFAYEPGRPILKGLDLRVEAGRTVAVVGGSGSGKSTLGRLLMRLYDVDGGRITLDGQDLRGLRLDSLRQAIGVVPQDTVLFNDTIAYNIGYGHEGAGMAQIIEAARAAQVHEFIVSLPLQYETVVGERGMKLSGGEKQRIAIARAFLKNPPVMIFDEATSALDTRAERAIQGELDRIAQGRTALVIAHRLSTVVDADEIIVMDRGRIAERGRHDALLAQQGLYAQLWSLQRQQRELEQLERVRGREPVNLAALLASAVDGLRPLLESRRVAVYSDIDLHSASVSGDPSMLAQTVHQLCRWAVCTTEPDGRVEMALRRQGVGARLTVAAGRVAPDGLDDPPELEPPDPLQVRAAIEREGGIFITEPPNATRGVRYMMELPLAVLAVAAAAAAPAPAARPAAAAGAAGGLPLAGLSVMCIDDQPEALSSLALLLESEGAAAATFTSGRAALQWLQAHESAAWPDLLVCDISLADEDGHAVIRQIRAIEAGRGVVLPQRLPSIALTGHAQPDDRLRALMAGFQLHLAKPVAARELVAALRSLAGRHD